MRYNDVSGGVVHDCRATLHYLIALFVMGGYSGRVCPMVDVLPSFTWFLHLGLLLVLIRGVRFGLNGLVLARVAPVWQVLTQFFMDALLLSTAGYVMSLDSGTGIGWTVELGCGFSILGFFIGADLALIHNRRMALKNGEGLFTFTAHFVSAPQKLVLLSIISLSSVMATLFFVFSNDLFWLVGLPPYRMAAARDAVIFNQGFILSVLMAYTMNIILTYARNVRLFLEMEIQTLAEVADGNYETRVPVVFNNELGVIASYTNRMILGFKEQTLMVERLRDVIINSMASLAETRDNETGSHIRRTQYYVKVLAETLATFPEYQDVLDATAIDLLYKTAPLHDIGKVGVPDAVLLKPGPLNDVEFAVMKQHTGRGEDAIRQAERLMGPGADTSFLKWAADIAGGHHEKWDGSGYPRGLAGEAIPLAARLMALADVYDALRSKRVYKKGRSHGEARKTILEGRGSHFEPLVVDAFLVCEKRFVGISTCFEDAEQGEPG